MRSLLGMCFDWRVLTGLAAVGVGVWVVAPQLVAPALPILVVLICPLSMLLMARMMGRSMTQAGPGISPTERLAALEREQARLDAEIARTRAEIVPSTQRAIVAQTGVRAGQAPRAEHVER